MPFPPPQASPPVSHDDYFPHNQNKNDLGKPRSFLVRVGRVELQSQFVWYRLNIAQFYFVLRNARFSIVINY